VSREQPNLLFVMTDHQRADSLGMTQAGVEVTPNLNRLASESAVFTRAYNTCPLCVPTRTALATGKYPTRTGVICNDWQGLTAGDHKPMHQYLAEAGYDVAHVGIHHIRVKPEIRERVPFVLWIDNADYDRHLEQNALRQLHYDCLGAMKKEITMVRSGVSSQETYSGTVTDVWPGPPEHFKDNVFADEAITFLRREHSRPFALFVYLWAPHPPLAVPEPYASMFDPSKIELPENVGMPADGEPPNRRQGMAGQLAEGVTMDEWRKVWAAHLGLVRLADDAIGRMLTALESGGYAEDTLVVFTVDHGEHLGQHRMYQKMEMYEQAIRVPLVFHLPGTRGKVFDRPVSHLDVLPTLIDLIGLECPDDLDGESLVESVVSGEAPPERTVFSMYAGNKTPCHHRRAAITRRWKYVYDPEDVPELYDLETDPLEMHNLAADPQHAQTVRELHDECRRWHEARGDPIRF